jgi:hypothetical protein
VNLTPEHTPGPWHSFGGAIYIGEPTAPVIIARTCHPDRHERLAHCDLIAAAPELLEALEALLAHLKGSGIDLNDCAEECQAAIAKARGEIQSC